MNAFTTDEWGYPAKTATGVRCGNHGSARVRHDNTEAVRACYEQAEGDRRQADAEYDAEMAIERYLENRGYDDARAQDEYEQRMGVIPFDVAFAAAMAN